MTTVTELLPACRADLVIRPIGEAGRYVVKLPGTHDYFHLGEEEHFLLTQLDGERDAEAVCAAFEARFGEPLSEEDLDGFVETAREQRLLENAECGVRNQTQKTPLSIPNSELRTRSRVCSTGGKVSSIRTGSLPGWSRRFVSARPVDFSWSPPAAS